MTLSLNQMTYSRNAFIAYNGCVQKQRKRDDYEFRSITFDDLKREHIVEEYIDRHLATGRLRMVA